MDSTENGHSDENLPKSVEDFLRLIQQGEFKKISIDDLPFDEREKIREFMEAIDDDMEPELFIADFSMQVEDLGLVPMEILSGMYRDALVDECFEDAQDIGEEIKKRGYSIDISEKSVSLIKTTDFEDK
jgi:hypothetical protein